MAPPVLGQENCSCVGAKPPGSSSVQREGEGVGAHWSPICAQAQWWPGGGVKDCPFVQSTTGESQHTRDTRYRRIIID